MPHQARPRGRSTSLVVLFAAVSIALRMPLVSSTCTVGFYLDATTAGCAPCPAGQYQVRGLAKPHALASAGSAAIYPRLGQPLPAVTLFARARPGFT